LTVHDELVFEVSETHVEQAAQVVRDRMAHAVDLDVPLQADIGWGPTWADASPEGH
jgi:DNA polymerase-1